MKANELKRLVETLLDGIDAAYDACWTYGGSGLYELRTADRRHRDADNARAAGRAFLRSLGKGVAA